MALKHLNFYKKEEVECIRRNREPDTSGRKGFFIFKYLVGHPCHGLLYDNISFQ